MLFYNILAATAAAMLAAMGVGGGGLAVIYLVLVLGAEQNTARGINLIFFIVASLCSLPLHAKKGRIKWRICAIFAAAGAIGAVIGCVIGSRIEPRVIRTAFGVFLMISGTLTLFGTLKNGAYKRFFRE